MEKKYKPGVITNRSLVKHPCGFITRRTLEIQILSREDSKRLKKLMLYSIMFQCVKASASYWLSHNN